MERLPVCTYPTNRDSIKVFSKFFKQFKYLNRMYDLKKEFNAILDEFRRPTLQQLAVHSSERQSFGANAVDEDKAQIYGPLDFVRLLRF